MTVQEFDDDDEAVEGADDDGQRTVDDPGERKELGIDLDEDEEAQEEEDIKRLKILVGGAPGRGILHNYVTGGLG